MKTTTLAGALAVILGIADCHPLNLKRDLVTEVVYTTVTVANVIVWVDNNGVAYETTTMDAATATESTAVAVPTPTPIASPPSIIVPTTAESPPPASPSPSSAALEVQAPPQLPPVPSSTVVEVPAAPPAPSPSSQAAPPAPATSAVQAPKPSVQSEPKKSSDDAFPLGITYDPFKQGGCKTEDEISGELESMKSFGIVRIYGMGCNVIPITVQRAKANNQKIMAGIYRSADPNNNENIDAVVAVLKSAIDNYMNGDWSIISLVSVENERVNAHEMTASDAVGIIQSARNSLRAAGYNGPVGAVETVPATVQNPSICAESDMALVNIHAWFDENVKAENAGDFVKDQIKQVNDACPNKRVIVTESGWPHQGDSHGNAVASPEAQKAALNSIRSKFDHDLFLFNAYDSLWKTDDAFTHNAEKYWGIM